jgi:hypothetical protein
MSPDFEDLSSPRSMLRESPEHDPNFRQHRPSLLTYALLAAAVFFVVWLTI